MVLEQLVYSHLSYTITKSQFVIIIVVRINTEFIRFLKENMREYLYKLGVSKGLLGKPQKAKFIKAKTIFWFKTFNLI